MFKLLDRIFCVIAALLASQFPRFIDTYATRLSGHVAEAQRVVDHFTKASESFGLTLSQYIAKFGSSIEPEFQMQGQIMQEAVFRLSYLTKGFIALTQAEWYIKPLYFFRYLDREVALKTFQYYSFGLDFTIQTIVWMGIGILIAIGFTKCLALFYQKLQRSVFHGRT